MEGIFMSETSKRAPDKSGMQFVDPWAKKPNNQGGVPVDAVFVGAWDNYVGIDSLYEALFLVRDDRQDLLWSLAKGDPLETIKKIVRWEDFRADIESVTATKPEERKSNAGRKPYDAIWKFKIVVLQSLHNLSDEQTDYLIRDRLSFMHFLDLNLEDPVPDATTIWLFREALAQAGLIDKLFERFGQHLEAEGYIARG